ncbi:hypothetical protein M407DRAFT_18641 [Tulasnella calospora MUT 4182]|uniref:Uncharacterized protein n=1 Tax=Tulasnella calospora MUT 4182 TaxID=1051891 RepID=A0A0C3QT85_9AGAM|nr:hypothetical protein M407DRAFT_18641 [Tulasnella calospora MUT 4182]
MIPTPNVTHLQIDFHDAHVPAALDIFTTPAVSRLRQASNLVIRISYDSFHLSTEIREDAPYSPQGVTIGLENYAETTEVPLRMLRDIDAAILRLPAIDLIINHGSQTAGIFNYLKSSRDVGFPLPGLHSVHLTAFLWDTIPYEEMVMDLARTRQDITKVTVRLRKNYGNDGQNFQWDAEHMALVLLE